MALYVSYMHSMGGGFGIGSCTFEDNHRLPTAREMTKVRKGAATAFNKENVMQITGDDICIISMLVLPDDDPAETP